MPLTRDDVEGVFAGLRPLLAGGVRRDLEAQPRAHRGAHRARARGRRRRQVDDLPDHGQGRDRRGGRPRSTAGCPESITDDVALLGAEGYHAAWNKRSKIARAFGVHKVRIEHLLNRYGVHDRRAARPASASAPNCTNRCPAPTTTSASRSSTRRRTRARCTSTTCSPAAPASRSRRGTAAYPPHPSRPRSWAGARLG